MPAGLLHVHAVCFDSAELLISPVWFAAYVSGSSSAHAWYARSRLTPAIAQAVVWLPYMLITISTDVCALCVKYNLCSCLLNTSYKEVSCRVVL